MRGGIAVAMSLQILLTRHCVQDANFNVQLQFTVTNTGA